MSKENKETNKRVSINEDGVLTIINDNATWVNGDVTTEIKGDYIINADDLRRLMVMITGQDLIVHQVDSWWYISDFDSNPKTIKDRIITTNKDIADEIEELNKAYHQRVKSETAANYDYNKLQEKVEKFNKSRHWWERKLKL